VTTEGGGGLPSSLAPGASIAWPAPGPSLSEIAGLVLEASVPRFADAVAVFALEALLVGGEPDGRTAGEQVIARRLGSGYARDGHPVVDPAFAAGEVLALDGGSPCSRCVRGGGPVIFGETDGQVLERAGYRDGAGATGVPGTISSYSSFLAVPMTAGHMVTGFLLFARGPAAPPFTVGDAGQVAGLAARAAGFVASACLAIGQQRIAAAQRQRLIPAVPRAPAGIEVAARCLPAPGQVSSGDWYDILPLPGGRAGLIAGDAMGHDQQAAAAMTQLRAAAHALGDLDLPPAEMLRRLDRTTAALGIVAFATCIYAVIDPASYSCVVARAGHLPAVIARPDGRTSAPDLPSGLPIGLGTAIYGQLTLPLPPGAILALYTDGLVDTRSRSSDEGVLELRSILAGQAGSLDDACDHLLRSLAPRPEDDTTVLLARIPPGEPLPPPPVYL
jgi:hypothetical protein